ncbi:MAG: DUF188 domain-containing protein [Treponema sp.]|jgi:uncharacterized protein YaiI (UPF0178 family)|nr:DUF188 domain-containing protein [Treponema sp.]
MKILVDADSCPRQVRDVVARAAKRTGIDAVFAANRPIPGIEKDAMVICPPESGSADNAIAERAGPGDIAVTRDIPLAARLVKTGAAVLDDRGRTYTAENIGERVSIRDFTVGLAENGMDFDRQANYGKRSLKAFADSLDRLLTKLAGKPGR